MRELMRRRWWWGAGEDRNGAEFVWSQLKVVEVFRKQKSGRLWLKEQPRKEEEEEAPNEGKVVAVGRRRKSKPDKDDPPDDVHLSKIFTP